MGTVADIIGHSHHLVAVRDPVDIPSRNIPVICRLQVKIQSVAVADHDHFISCNIQIAEDRIISAKIRQELRNQRKLLSICRHDAHRIIVTDTVNVLPVRLYDVSLVHIFFPEIGRRMVSRIPCIRFRRRCLFLCSRGLIVNILLYRIAAVGHIV